MSRLKSLTIPFIQGYSDEVDPKILPDGLFADVTNGRLHQRGALRLRRGWRPLDMSETVADETLVAYDVYSYRDTLVALCARQDSTGRTPVLAGYNAAAATRPWRMNSTSPLPPVTTVRHVGNMPDLPEGVTFAGAAVTADGTYGAVIQQTSAPRTVVRVFKYATDETVFYADIGLAASRARLVSLGTTFGLIFNNGTALRFSTLDPSAVNPTFGNTVTLLTATVTWFDVAVARLTTPNALHVAYIEAAVASYGKFDVATGAQIGSTKVLQATFAGSVALCTDDTLAHAVIQNSSTLALTLTTFAATGAFGTTAGPTSVFAAGAIQTNFFAVDYVGASGSIYIAGQSGSTTVVHTRMTVAHAVADGVSFLNALLVSGWVLRGADRGRAGFGYLRDSTVVYGDARGPWLVDNYYGCATALTAPFTPGQSQTHHTVALLPRNKAGTFYAVADARTFSLLDTVRRPAVQFDDTLYITGGAMTQLVVDDVSENGMLAPVIRSLTGSNGAGALANGTYTYRAMMSWTDPLGRTHRSIVGTPLNVTLAGANDTVTAIVDVPKTLRRDGNLICNPNVELYRTEAGPGELFYLTASGPTLTTTDAVTLTDTKADADLIDEARLYTEGEFGAVSGALDIAPPNETSYVAALRSRLVGGSGGPEYQFSQTALPNEPVAFTQSGVSGTPGLAYLDAVEGRITGVATMDETAIIGTSKNLFIAGGEGPNLAGIGEFESPARLPTDVGFYDFRSVFETSEGLWFQGSADTMYLLPRGQSSPAPDHSVQSHLTTAIVGAGYDATDNVAAWALTGARALVRDLAIKQWFGDGLPFTPVALTSVAGRLYAVASTGVVWAQDATAYGDGTSGATAVVLQATTGAVSPFTLAGQGRLACVELLGEFRASAAILGEISYDDGVSWTALGTAYSVTGLTVGATFQRQWHPAVQRGDRFRFRITMTPTVTTTEGCRLNGLTLSFTQRGGPSRLASALRK